MTNKKYKAANYKVDIQVAKPVNNVFNHVINLSKWWPEEFEGSCDKLNDEFVFRTGDGHYSKNKVIEFAPNKRIVWLTTESRRKADNFDWTGTKMIVELIPEGAGTLVKFTYDGVILENEADRLAQICDFVIKEKLYSFIESFTVTIELSKSPREVFNHITNDVARWWGGNDLEGSSKNLHDEFIIHHPGAHYSKQKVVEFIPSKKITWLVTESTMDWLQKDKHEWTNTKMIFEIEPKGDNTMLNFTHEGLVPAKECYALCHEGWKTVITDYLFNYINEWKAHFKL